MPDVLSAHGPPLIDAYGTAADDLAVGQLYLLANPLLQQPLTTRAYQTAIARPLERIANQCSE